MSLEETIRAAHARRDFDGATTATLRAYGPEIFSLLLAMHRDRTQADEAFSVFAERLWTTMGRFEWACSMRTWAYLLARRAARDVRRSARPRAQRHVALSETSAIGALVAQVRTQTASIYAQENRDAIAKLRDELPEEDQLLLVLRVDRGLEWQDLARVFLEGEETPSEEDVKRESARLRKRFQLVKERLLAMGTERGLLRR